jgi:hypothetical protein
VAIPSVVSTILPLAAATAAAIGAIMVTRRHRPTVIIIAGLTSAAVGWLTSAQLLTHVTPLDLIGYSLPVAAVIAGLGAVTTAISRITAATVPTHRHPPTRPDTPRVRRAEIDLRDPPSTRQSSRNSAHP